MLTSFGCEHFAVLHFFNEAVKEGNVKLFNEACVALSGDIAVDRKLDYVLNSVVFGYFIDVAFTVDIVLFIAAGAGEI